MRGRKPRNFGKRICNHKLSLWPLEGQRYQTKTRNLGNEGTCISSSAVIGLQLVTVATSHGDKPATSLINDFDGFSFLCFPFNFLAKSKRGKAYPQWINVSEYVAGMWISVLHSTVSVYVNYMAMLVHLGCPVIAGFSSTYRLCDLGRA
jgi:hypothetical protein